ncbi:MAG: fimbrial protein [Bacteroides sp.]|jgi:hypothetical protein|nr:fimbrial protein [Bacteroides sp.]
MKKSALFFVFATGLLLASCGDSANDPDPQSLPKDAKMSITLQGTPVSRSTGAALPSDNDDGEKKINRVAVGIFFSNDNSNKVNTVKEFEADVLSSNKTPLITCASGTGQKVVVVVNAPANTFVGADGKPKNINTYSDFVAKTVALSGTVETIEGVQQQTSTNLPMSGEASLSIAAGATISDFSVAVSRLVARVSLSSFKTQFESTGLYPSAEFKITDVFMYKANSVSSVEPALDFPTGLGTPLSGEDTDNEWLKETITGATATGETSENLLTSKYWFYVFANSYDAETSASQTRLVIKGEWYEKGSATPDAGDGTVYYPVVINQLQPGTEIKDGATPPITEAGSKKGDGKVYRNCKYDVSVVIKGKGGSTPDANISPANLNVSIVPAGWSLDLSQTVVFE